MKKLIVLFMVFALVGCGASGDGKDSENVTGAITIYTRDSSSGTREAFEKATGLSGELSKTAIEVSSNGDMATKVGADKNAIGYASLSTDFNANNIKPLKFEGVEPTEANILDSSYKMQRPFSFVTRAKDDFASKEKEALVAAFLDYIQNSTEGMQVVEKAGGVVDASKSVPWAQLKENHPITQQDNSQITLSTSGSTSVEKTIKAALESFQTEAGKFLFTMNQTGSGDGYKRVLGSEKDGANKADIGFASRAFDDTKEPVQDGMMSGQYCIDAVVAVVSIKNSDVETLDKEQVKNIFTGTTGNWEDIK